MAEALLQALLTQSLLLSGGIALLGLGRQLVLRCGPQAVYAAWLLVPALLLTPLLPRPAHEPAPWRLLAGDSVAVAAPAAVPAPPALAAPLVLALWCSGVVGVALVQSRRQLRLRPLRRSGQRLPAGFSPALVGLFPPRLLLPADFERRFTPAQQALILAHEQVHRQRHDNLWNLLASALAALHWWNPLAWWAVRRLQADQELACDAAVLRAHPHARPDYTQALLAAHDLHHLRAPLASRWGSAHPLVERIAMLKPAHAPTRRQLTVLALTLLGTAGLAYAAQGGTPTPGPDAATQEKVDIRLNVTSGSFKATPRLITTLGTRSSLQWGATPAESWRLEFTVTRADDGRLQVLTLPSYGGRALGEHLGLIASGASAGFRFGGSGGAPELQMTRVVTLLPANVALPAPPRAASAP